MAKKEPTLNDLKNYEAEYSEPKFWNKIAEVAKKAGEKVIRLALLLYYIMKSPSVPVKDKAIIIGALGYFILPIDLIPDLIPVLGFTDDLAALTLAYKAVNDNVTPEITAQADSKTEECFA